MSLTIHAFLACCVVCSFTLRDLSTPQQAEEGSIDVRDDTIQEANQTGFIGTSSVLGEIPREGMMCEPPTKMLERYDVGRGVGKGSFGLVSIATPKGSIPVKQTLVVKEMNSIQEFKNVEVDPPRLRLAFNSPEIVEAFYDPRASNGEGRKRGKIHLVLPALDSGGGEKLKTLYDKVGRATGRTFPTDFQNEVFEITCMLAWGVYNLHLAGFIHLDLKLENFMMHRVVPGKDHFKAVIIDYGLCKFYCGPEKPLCGEGVAGSPPFMSIAQWKNVLAKEFRRLMMSEAEDEGRTVTEAEAKAEHPNIPYGPDCDWFAWAIIAHMLKTNPNDHPFNYGWDQIPPGSDFAIYAAEVLNNLKRSMEDIGGPPNLARSYSRATAGGDLLFNILADKMRSKKENRDEVVYYSRDPRDHPVLQHNFFYTDEATGEIKLEAFLPIGWRQGRGHDGLLVYYLDKQSEMGVWRWSGQEGVEKVGKYHVRTTTEPTQEKANTIIVRMTPDRPDLCKILAGVYIRLEDDKPTDGNARYVKENVVSHDGGENQQVFLYKARDRWVFYHVLEYPWDSQNMKAEPFTIGRFVFGYSEHGGRLPPTTGWVFPKPPFVKNASQDLNAATAVSQQELGLRTIIEFPTREFMMTRAAELEDYQFPGTVRIKCISGGDGPWFDKRIGGSYRMDAFPFHLLPQYKSMKKIDAAYLRLYFMAGPAQYRGWYIGPDPGSMHTLAFLPVEKDVILFPWEEKRWQANGRVTHVDELMGVPGFRIQMTLAGEEKDTGKTRIPYELSYEGVFWRRLCDDYHPLSKQFEPAVECTRFQDASAVEKILSNPLCRTDYRQGDSVIIQGLDERDPLRDYEGARATVRKGILALGEDLVSLELDGGMKAAFESKYVKKI